MRDGKSLTANGDAKSPGRFSNSIEAAGRGALAGR
jgi:hypothetical protein